MDYGGVPDRHVVANKAGVFIGQMHHGVVLNVRVVPDDDSVDVAAYNCVIPDTRRIADRNVAEHNSPPRYVNAPAKHRLLGEEHIESPTHIIHGTESREVLPVREVKLANPQEGKLPRGLPQFRPENDFLYAALSEFFR
jgi:hypothetical protein